MPGRDSPIQDEYGGMMAVKSPEVQYFRPTRISHEPDKTATDRDCNHCGCVDNTHRFRSGARTDLVEKGQGARLALEGALHEVAQGRLDLAFDGDGQA